MGLPGRGRVAVGAAILYIFLWASAYVPSKVAALESPALWFLAVRFGAAGLILTVLALALRRAWPATWRAWLVAAVLGVLANALYLGLTYTALHHLSSGMGAIIASTNPLVLALVAPWLLGEKLTGPKLAGMLLGFAGVLAIVAWRTGTQTALPLDVALACGGVLSSVASTILFKRWAAQSDLLVLNAIQLLSASLVVIPVAFWTEGVPRVSPTPELVGAFVYLVLVLSVGASLLWFWLLARGEASRVSAFFYLTPVFGLGLSALLLHEFAHRNHA